MSAPTRSRTCTFTGCDHTQHAEGLCFTHSMQLQLRGRDMSKLTPLRAPRRTDDTEVRLDVHDYLFLTTTCQMPPAAALRRMHLSAKTMIRRFKQLNKPIPDGLWGIDSRRPVAP